MRIPHYNFTMQEGVVCTILGADATFSIGKSSTFAPPNHDVTYIVQAVGDDTGGVPAGSVDLYVDDDLVASGLAFDATGTLTYTVADQSAGEHQVSIAYYGGSYYYPGGASLSYTNFNTMLCILIGGGVLLAAAVAVPILVVKKRGKGKTAKG